MNYLNKRSLYFLLDRLHVTRAERITMLLLITLVSLLAILRPLLKPSHPFEAAYYRKADSLFALYSAAREQEQKEMLKSYHGVMEYNKNGDDTLYQAAIDAANNSRKRTSGKASSLPAKRSIELNSIILNRASLTELTQLPGIGPKTAQAIISYREEHGSFTDIAELTKVKGIGPKKWEQIRPYLRLNP